jgi:hypothetical protein
LKLFIVFLDDIEIIFYSIQSYNNGEILIMIKMVGQACLIIYTSKQELALLIRVKIKIKIIIIIVFKLDLKSTQYKTRVKSRLDH